MDKVLEEINKAKEHIHKWTLYKGSHAPRTIAMDENGAYYRCAECNTVTWMSMSENVKQSMIANGTLKDD